jgi:hypothetical protein
VVHLKGVGSSKLAESQDDPARRQYGELLVEIVELERRYPELVEVRRVKLNAAAAGRATPKSGRFQPRLRSAKAGRTKKRYRTESSARAAATEKAAKKSAHKQPPAKPGSHVPVPPPHITASDPVGNLSATLAAELRRNADVDLTNVSVPKLVQSLLRVIPRKADSNELAHRIGPFYDTAGLKNWLGVSRQALEKRISAGKLIACVTSDRVRLYPVWQFMDSGALQPGLPEVLAALRKGTEDGWIVAAWLTTPTEELEGTAIEWLTKRHDPAPVIELAHHDAAAWAA